MLVEEWLGTDKSYNNYLEAYQKALDAPAEQKIAFYEDSDRPLYEVAAEEMLSVSEGVGIITVKGPMIPETGFFSYIFGMTGYDAIAQAVVMAIEDENIKRVLLNIDSPGGAANGIQSLGRTIKQASQIKAVDSFSSSRALSAGFWLAATGEHIYGDSLSEFGSIGAVLTLTSHAKQLRDEGIDIKVLRAGKDKAPYHPAEPISEKVMKVEQKKLDYMHSVFVNGVLEARPSLSGVPRSKWAEGGTFFSPEAIEIGMIDGPMTSLQDLVYKLSQKGDDMARKKGPVMLPASARAAVESGAALSVEPQDDKVETPEGGAEGAVQAQSNQGEGQAQTEMKAAEGGAQRAPEAGEAKAQAQAPEGEGQGNANANASQSDPVVAVLREQLTQRELKIEELQDKFGEMKAQYNEVANKAEQFEKFIKPIAFSAISKLEIACGFRPTPETTLKQLTPEGLKDHHAEVYKSFTSAYPDGKVSLEADDSSQQTKDKQKADSDNTLDLSSFRLNIV